MILLSASLALTAEYSNDNAIRASFWEGRVGRGWVFFMFSSISTTTCSEIRPGSSKLVGWSVVVGTDFLTFKNSLKVLQQSVWHFSHPFLVFFIIIVIDLVCRAEATFHKAVFNYAGMMDSHAIKTPHTPSKMFQFLIYSAGTSLSISSNKKHTRCLQCARFIQ